MFPAEGNCVYRKKTTLCCNTLIKIRISILFLLSYRKRRQLPKGNNMLLALKKHLGSSFRIYAGQLFHRAFQAPHRMPIVRFKPRCIVAGALACLPLLFPTAQAADYPTNTVRMVVAFPAGGGLDMTARLLAQKLLERWNQPVVVDNRPGASGMIGAESVARSPKDGYTIFMASPAEISINPGLYPKMTYDPFTELSAVSLVAQFPMLLVANSEYSVTSFDELRVQSGKDGDGIAFATSGIGSMQHLIGEWLNRNADMKLLHVPYKGTGPAMNDLLGGQVPLGIMGLAPLVQHIQAGKLRPLAITSSERNALVPEVPTLKELGNSFESTIWFGVLVPAGTPNSIIEKLQKDISEVIAQDSFREQMVKMGGEAVSSAPEEFTAFIKEEFDKYSKIIKDAKIEAN